MALAVALVAYPSAAEAAGKPDLIVSSVVPAAGSLAPGQSFVVVDRVVNRGTVAASASSTGYYLSLDGRQGAGDVRLGGVRKVARLAPGRTSTGRVTLKIPSSTRAGLYQVIACADVARRVRESRETNNCRAAGSVLRRILVTPAPPAPSPLSVTSSPAPASAVTQDVDADAGGTITATGPDGTTYSLAIPARALSTTTSITVTPVSSLSGSGLGGRLIGAVELSPDGLQLSRPATLTITPASPTVLTPAPGYAIDGFSYEGEGRDFHLFPTAESFPGAAPNATSLHYSVMHFTGFTGQEATPAEEVSVEGHLSVAPAPSFEATVAKLNIRYRDGTITEAQWTSGLSDALVASFFRDVLPVLNHALNSSVTWEDAHTAVAAYEHWARWVEILGLAGGHNARYKVDFDTLDRAGHDGILLIAGYVFTSTYNRCMAGIEPQVQYQHLLTLAHEVLSLDETHVADILGADYQARIDECGNRKPRTWAGTISYSWDAHGSCTGTCKLDLSEGTGVLHVHFVEETAGNQHWLNDGSDYLATAHTRTETAGPNCTLVEDDTSSTSGPITPSEGAFYLSNYANNTYAYLGFDAARYVDVHIVSTNSDCTTDDFVATHQWHQYRAAGGACPALPRHDGDPSPGLRATKTSQNGHAVLDFACDDTQTTSGGTTHIHVTGTLIESP